MGFLRFSRRRRTRSLRGRCWRSGWMLLLGRIFETGPKLIPGEAAKVKFGSGAANSTSLFFLPDSCQKLPSVAKSCHQLSKYASSCQKLTSVAKNCHKLPKDDISCQKMPSVAKSCHNLPKVAISWQKVAISCQKLPSQSSHQVVTK